MAFSIFGKKNSPAPNPGERNARAPERADAKRSPAVKGGAPKAEVKAAGPVESERDQIEIMDSSSALHPAVEEAAILYANGQDSMALGALEGAVGERVSGAAAEQLWSMLFDLYLLMGRRESFEARALDYSVKFEKSPPTWVDLGKDAVAAPLGGAQGSVAFGARLDANSDKTVKQLERVITANPVARLDLSRIQSADGEGCALLLGAFRVARRAKCELVVNGADSFMQLLGRLAVPERREHEPAWHLLLELYQHTGQQEQFDEMAVQYAVTFEVSPPSWEKPPVARRRTRVPAEPAPTDRYMLAGSISSASAEPFARLQEYAEGADPVIIDCTSLRRIDFVSAGTLLNRLVHLQALGKPVLVRGTNAMVNALFGVLGIPQFAKVERRRG